MSHIKQQKQIPFDASQEEAALDAWRRAAAPKLIQTLSKPDRTNLRDHTVDSVMRYVKQQRKAPLEAFLEDAALDAWRRAAVPKLVQTLSRPDRTNLREHTVESVMNHYMHYSFWGQQELSHPITLSLAQHLECHPSSSERIEHSPFVGSSVLDAVTLEQSKLITSDHEELVLNRLMQEPDTFYSFTAHEPGPSPLATLISSTSGYPLNCAWFVQTLIDSSDTDWSKVMDYIAPYTLQQLSRHV
jgi:hypothetical protein